MDDCFEFLDRRAADALRRRIRIGILGMLRLEVLKAPHHLIEVVVAHLGSAEVVEAIVTFELDAELVDV